MKAEEFIEKWAIKILDDQGNNLITNYQFGMTTDLEQYKKDVLLEFLYWWIPEIHSQDAHSQVNKFESYLKKEKATGSYRDKDYSEKEQKRISKDVNKWLHDEN